MKCKPNAELESRPAGAEIEVTPEMIEAGVGAFCAYDCRFEGPEHVVVEIFEAMQAASLTEPIPGTAQRVLAMQPE